MRALLSPQRAKICRGNLHLKSTQKQYSIDVQASKLPQQAQLVKGDVYQFSTLERAMADSNVMFIATGSRPAFDPFGPFNIDYQVLLTDTRSFKCCEPRLYSYLASLSPMQASCRCSRGFLSYGVCDVVVTAATC